MNFPGLARRCLAAAAVIAAGTALAGAPESLDAWAAGARREMVDLLAAYSPEHRVRDAKVLAAMREVPRHEFGPKDIALQAYGDGPLIVGLMTEALELKASDKVF